jgi:hypothetical protein
MSRPQASRRLKSLGVATVLPPSPATVKARLKIQDFKALRPNIQDLTFKTHLNTSVGHCSRCSSSFKASSSSPQDPPRFKTPRTRDVKTRFPSPQGQDFNLKTRLESSSSRHQVAPQAPQLKTSSTQDSLQSSSSRPQMRLKTPRAKTHVKFARLISSSQAQDIKPRLKFQASKTSRPQDQATPSRPGHVLKTRLEVSSSRPMQFQDVRRWFLGVSLLYSDLISGSPFLRS